VAMMKKILYGKSDFTYMIRANGYYVDKTHYIKELESLGTEYLTFLRPRRFGKSLFISMLEAYYDINTADQFDEIFGELYIGKNPTELRNSYPILKFDFSPIASGSIEQTEASFNNAVLGYIRLFYTRYESLTGGEKVFLDNFSKTESATDTLNTFIGLMQVKQTQFYLLIDEYDNFANNILATHGQNVYHSVTHGTGFLRTFFTAIKTGTASNTVARMFSTGVSPLVMSDVTSGFNIDRNISQAPLFNDMVGFTQEEVETAVDYYIGHKVVAVKDRERMLEIMKKNYDGYLFSPNARESVYNSNSVLYLLDMYTENNTIPDEVIDTKMITDYHKLKLIITKGQDENNNLKILKSILLENKISAKLVRDFSAQDLIELDKFVSFMYYLGLLTIVEKSILSHVFTIPNEMCKSILWEYIRQAIQETHRVNLLEVQNKLEAMLLKGAWEPFFKYVFEEFYKLASIRDFIFREEGVKCFLLAYLRLTDLYEIYSETELNKGYADIYIKPKSNAPPTMCKNHYLVELKHLSQGDLKPKASQKLIDQTIKQAKAQLDQYANDSLIPKDVIKIIAITSNSELLHLSAEPNR
jgi:hypothetical protein